MTRTVPKLETFACGPSPVRIIHDFLTEDETATLFNALAAVPRDILQTPPMYGGVPAKRQTITFYEGDEAAADTYMNKFGDKGIHARPYAEAPPELNAARCRLQQMSKKGNQFALCYINFYKDETTQIGMHRDREEENALHSLVMLTLGGTRVFSIWKAETISAWRKQVKQVVADWEAQPENAKALKAWRNKKTSVGRPKPPASTLPKRPNPDWEEETQDGDLVIMPVGFHNKDGYFHAVLPQKPFAAPRFSLTFRNPDLSATGPWSPPQVPTPATRLYCPANPTPHVYCCKAGHEYPEGAIYVGCKTTRGQGREGTIFGNALDPLKRRGKSNTWAAEDENKFRAYAKRKMLDPDFRACVENLRGQNLLCWCEQEGTKRAEFCHARVWLEMANSPEALDVAPM